jgi:hypothetical protein
MQDAIAALNVYQKSKTHGEELLKALGLGAIKVSHITFCLIYTDHECILRMSYGLFHTLILMMQLVSTTYMPFIWEFGSTYSMN